MLTSTLPESPRNAAAHLRRHAGCRERNVFYFLFAKLAGCFGRTRRRATLASQADQPLVFGVEASKVMAQVMDPRSPVGKRRRPGNLRHAREVHTS
jgi:hypothetical protein